MADLLLINARVTTLDRANPVAEAVAQWRASTSDAVYTQPNIPVPHTAGQDGPGRGATASCAPIFGSAPTLRLRSRPCASISARRPGAPGGHDGSYLGVEVKSSW